MEKKIPPGVWFCLGFLLGFVGAAFVGQELLR